MSAATFPDARSVVSSTSASPPPGLPDIEMHEDASPPSPLGPLPLDVEVACALWEDNLPAPLAVKATPPLHGGDAGAAHDGAPP